MNNKNLLTIDDLNPILNHIGQFDHVSKTQIIEHINHSPFQNKHDVLHHYLIFHKNIPAFLKYKYKNKYGNEKTNIAIEHLITDFCNTGSPLELFNKVKDTQPDGFNMSRRLYNGFIITITQF